MSDNRRTPATAIVAALLAATVTPAVTLAQQSYVIVMSADRTPVIGLGSEDIVLRDGGVRQATLAVEPARDPLAIVAASAGLDSADLVAAAKGLDDMRRAVIAANAASHVVDITKPIETAATASPLTGTIARATSSLAVAATDRRVVVLIVRHRNGEDASADAIVNSLYEVRAALWVVEIRAPGEKVDPNVDAALNNGSKIGGALRQTVANADEVPAALATIANLLLAQYVVSYRWPDPMLSQLAFTTRHDRGEILAPAWQR